MSKKQWKFNWTKATLFTVFIGGFVFVKAQAKGNFNPDYPFLIIAVVVSFTIFGFLDSIGGD